MKTGLLMMFPLVLSLTNNAIGGINYSTNTSTMALTSSYSNKQTLTKAQVDNILKNNKCDEVYVGKGLDLCIYRKYELSDTREKGESRFLNISIQHNPSLADTNISLDSISLVGASFSQGWGFTVEGKVPGYYSSYSANFSATISTETEITEGASFKLGEKNSAGTYYLYATEFLSDCIIVKETTSGTFISAEYYTSCPADGMALEALTVRPVTGSGVLPSC